MGIMSTFYTPETGHNPCSNFSRHGFWYNGVWWETNEHFYQAHKATDPEQREVVRLAASPGQAKRMGGPRGIVDLRMDWDAVKIPVMRIGLAQKFLPDNEAGQFLLDTDQDLLIEGNTWGDRFWGQVDGEGDNWLGHLLMSRRAELFWMIGRDDEGNDE